MVHYQETLEDITTDKLHGFFEGWPDPPSTETHLKILAGSSHVGLALDEKSGDVIGFITAISDGVSAAYIPYLEVLPSFRNRGIGRDLVRRMLVQLEHFYMVDLICDKEMTSFYQSLGLRVSRAMSIRNYARQAGN
jgi:ribosomal protein S18 acetylase RimI-like enzyme